MIRERHAWKSLVMVLGVLFIAGACTAAQESETGEKKQLVMLVDEIPTGLNIDGPSISLATSQFGMHTLYTNLVEYPVTYSSDGSAESDLSTLRGELAESWQQNGREWTFTLRKGVTSCAGNEFTADDVIYTFERAKSVSGPAPIGWFIRNVASIFDTTPLAPDATQADKELKGEIEKVDDYTVRIRQFEENQLFLPATELFSSAIYDSKAMEEHATNDDPWAHVYADEAGAGGFGPYCLESWTKGSEIVFNRNKDWNVEPLPYYDRVVVRKVPQGSNRIQALRGGSVDIVTGLTTSEFASLKDVDGVRVHEFPGTLNNFLHMNFDVKPFDNIALRQALAYAIPYDEIVQEGYDGLARKWDGVCPSIFPGFQETSPYEYDPQKARDLLAEAGYPNGEGLQEFASSFELSYPTERQEQLQPVATIILDALREINVPIDLNPMPASQFGERVQVKRDLPLALNDSTTPLIPDLGYCIQVLYIPLELGGATDTTNYNNERVNDLWVEGARSEPNADQRLEMIRQALEVATEDVAIAPLVEVNTTFASGDDVTGFVWLPTDTVRLRYLRPEGETYDEMGNVADE